MNLYLSFFFFFKNLCSYATFHKWRNRHVSSNTESNEVSDNKYFIIKVVSNPSMEDDAASAISSEAGREAEPEGEETETAPEGEGDDEDSVTRCIW